MEVTSQYLHHESYIVEPTPWKLSHGTYTIEGTLLEYTPWKLAHETYTI